MRLWDYRIDVHWHKIKEATMFVMLLATIVSLMYAAGFAVSTQMEMIGDSVITSVHLLRLIYGGAFWITFGYVSVLVGAIVGKVVDIERIEQ